MKTIDSHDSEMNEKFQNSQFLKLMSSIGNRQVELEGDKLVTSDSKEDIREKGIPETITATNPTITTAPRDTLEGQFTLQGPSNPDFAREMYDQIHDQSQLTLPFPIPHQETVNMSNNKSQMTHTRILYLIH